MKKLLGLVCIFVIVLLSSCDLLGDLFGNKDNNKKNYVEGETKTFKAINQVTNKVYTLTAELVKEGAYCKVWVERGARATKTQVEKLANEYDTKIYPRMIENFSITNFKISPGIIDAEHITFNNVMELADMLSANPDGKLCILLLDIRDGASGNSPYTAGYFYPADFFPERYSAANGEDMIYIDTYPGNVDNSYSTLAHEMQHLMNFATSIAKRLDDDSNYSIYMDTWIDEGLASAAEWIYEGKHLTEERIKWFINNGKVTSDGRHTSKGKIDTGNNFFIWDNHDENVNAILDDYSTVYLFFQWLRLQSPSGSGIYKNIISSTKSNHESVINAMKPAYTNWESLMETWLAANYINAGTGPYGYKNDGDLKLVRVPEQTTNKTVQLAPGEGVYSLTTTTPDLGGQGTNIKNVYIQNSALTNNFVSGSILLTYNSNDAIILRNGKNEYPVPPETGKTTGIQIPAVSANIISAGRSISSEDFSRPRIDGSRFQRLKEIDKEYFKGLLNE